MSLQNVSPGSLVRVVQTFCESIYTQLSSAVNQLESLVCLKCYVFIITYVIGLLSSWRLVCVHYIQRLKKSSHISSDSKWVNSWEGVGVGIE